MVTRFRTRDHLRPQVLSEYQVEWCAHCDFGTIAGKFNPCDVASFYTSEYYTHVASGDSGKRSASMLDRLRVHLAWRADRGVVLSPSELKPSQPVYTLCDVGCGGGHTMALFKQAGYDVVGIEPDPAARALASKVGEVFEGTVESLPRALAGRKFAVVLLSHVLEHSIDPAPALENLKSLIAPGGTLVIEVPNNAARGFQMYGPGWFFADIPRHLQFFTEKSLRKALDSAGFLVTEVIYTGYTRQFSTDWLAAQKAIRTHTGLNAGQGWTGNVWRLLATTAFARPDKKYDSIRIHAMERP
jgi:SAM-dependent methyltransferase